MSIIKGVKFVFVDLKGNIMHNTQVVAGIQLAAGQECPASE